VTEPLWLAENADHFSAASAATFTSCTGQAPSSSSTRGGQSLPPLHVNRRTNSFVNTSTFFDRSPVFRRERLKNCLKTPPSVPS
jgi:hypothetical protein